MRDHSYPFITSPSLLVAFDGSSKISFHERSKFPAELANPSDFSIQPKQSVEKLENLQMGDSGSNTSQISILGTGSSKRLPSKAEGSLAGGAYKGVREHDNGPRTPLAGFFNTLLDSWLPKSGIEAQPCIALTCCLPC